MILLFKHLFKQAIITEGVKVTQMKENLGERNSRMPGSYPMERYCNAHTVSENIYILFQSFENYLNEFVEIVSKVVNECWFMAHRQLRSCSAYLY